MHLMYFSVQGPSFKLKNVSLNYRIVAWTEIGSCSTRSSEIDVFLWVSVGAINENVTFKKRNFLVRTLENL